MSPVASPGRARLDSPAPVLRLLPDPDTARPELLRARELPRPALRVVTGGPTHVLVAGADPCRRAKLLDELTQTLPAATVFEEADAVCDVLGHAPTSRMAFLTGDLNDAPAQSVMQMLAHRHPRLPVLVLDNPAR